MKVLVQNSSILQKIAQKVALKERISSTDALDLAALKNPVGIAHLANQIAREKNGQRVAFLIDRNINYTNVCEARCSFCAFYRPHPNHKQSYDLTFEQIDQKIDQTLAMGGTRILMQGGLHHHHTLETYVELISHIRQKYPTLTIHAFSPPEIHHVAVKAKLSYDEVIQKLKEAGLESIPGGGAEILVDRVRDKIAVGKCNADEWLAVMRSAHQKGVPSTATMMLGHIETWQERIEHLEKIRALQDETNGFLSFIPWTFQPDNTPLHPKIKRNKNVRLASAYEYLKFLAIARLYLDNFQHLQVSLLTQGQKVAQMGLRYGADDLGSFLIEENVVRLAGREQELGLAREKMIQMIHDCGFTAYERDTFYQPIVSNQLAS